MAGERRQERPPAPRTIGGEQPFVEALAARYRGALTQFFERRAPQLKSDSEDLTQEVFLQLPTRGAGEEIEDIDGYIFETASSVLTDCARRNAVRAADRHVCYQEETHAVEDFSPERVLLAREQVAMVRTVLERLPDKVRAAFVLHRCSRKPRMPCRTRTTCSASTAGFKSCSGSAWRRATITPRRAFSPKINSKLPWPASARTSQARSRRCRRTKRLSHGLPRRNAEIEGGRDRPPLSHFLELSTHPAMLRRNIRSFLGGVVDARLSLRMSRPRGSSRRECAVAHGRTSVGQ